MSEEDLEQEWEEIEEGLRGEYDEENMENRKASWMVAIIAAAGASLFGPVISNIIDRWFTEGGNTRDSVIELTVEVRGLKDQVTKLTNEPYATREELREVRTELTRFDERLDGIERKQLTNFGSQPVR